MEERAFLDRNEFIGRAFSTAVYDVLSTMAGLEPVEIQGENNFSDRGGKYITGAMTLAGKRSSMASIRMDSDTAALIVSYMTGIIVSEANEEDLYDGTAELVNMVCGRAKAALADSDEYFQLTSPFIVTGDNYVILYKNRIQKLEKSFRIGEGILTLELACM
ncbi:MAG: chemotaxis protein CheX [Clostridia bacterium]|nr:chemotaxis protein CheX [Clostridia bacterium]